jgi:DNA-binding MarR family transcriptional regulator
MRAAAPLPSPASAVGPASPGILGSPRIPRARQRQPAGEVAPARPNPPTSGLEAGLSRSDHLSLRLWLRLLSCSTDIETQIRRRLRREFGITLARFDYLAQLHRHPQGLRMNILSRHLMVTGGNVTGLTDELEKEGFVSREADPADRRSWRVSLTEPGIRAFEAMAQVHEAWVVELLGGVSPAEQKQLHDLLGRLRLTAEKATAPTNP